MNITIQKINNNIERKYSLGSKKRVAEQKNIYSDYLNTISNYNRAKFTFRGTNSDNFTPSYQLNNHTQERKDLPYILYSLTEQNKDIITSLINLKDKDGNYFRAIDIKKTAETVNDINKDIVQTLIDSRINDNNLFAIKELAQTVTNGNKDIIKTLINFKDSDGNYRFKLQEITEFAKIITDQNKNKYNTIINSKENDFLNTLINMKDKNNCYKLSCYSIMEFARISNELNKNVIIAMINSNDKYGNCRFKSSEIKDIAEVVTDTNKDIIMPLSNVKDNDNNYRFNPSEIKELAKVITDKNKDIFNNIINSKENYFINTLINEKDEYDSYRLSCYDILNFIMNSDDINKDVIIKLLNSKKDDNYRFEVYNILEIAEGVTKDNKDLINTLIDLQDNDNNFLLNSFDIKSLISESKNNYCKKYINSIIKKYKEGNITSRNLVILLRNINIISDLDIKYLEKTLGKDFVNNLNSDDLVLVCKFCYLANKQNINEIPIKKKREFLRKLVALNDQLFELDDNIKKYFPLIPTNQKEYCSILPQLVKSIGIEVKELSEEEINNVENEINELSDILSYLSDEEFNELKISQKYSNHEFIKDTFNKVKDLSKQERQKVYDYFGFELNYNNKGCQVDGNIKNRYSISGYPTNLNNDQKFSEIRDPKTKAVIEELRPYVIKYSENNKILCSNEELEESLNKIIKSFPELRSEIERLQHGTQIHDLFKHSLKVVQKIVQNPKFYDLNDSDEKVILLAGLFHDITKTEKQEDTTHSKESAFDSYYILKKLKLTKDEEIKLYSLIKNHEWFKYVNDPDISNYESEKRCKSVAFDMQYGNLFQMSKIFTEADMKAVKNNDDFFNKHKANFEIKTDKIKKLIQELKKTQPLLPITKIPKASRIEENIKKVNPDGSTNIKGVYKNKDGLIIIKYNEVRNNTWEQIGFPKGSISHGIGAVGKSIQKDKITTTSVDTGNIKFFAHGLNYEYQLNNFSTFALPDSEALLSVSYMERPESKYRMFRTQGVLLNTEAKYVHGGGKTDAGSGYEKNINEFKNNYIFGGFRESDRKFISNLIKKTLNLTDIKYVQFVKENANKSFSEINPIDVRNKIIKAFSGICSNVRLGKREYNEMYITNPEIMATYAYSENDNVGDVIKFVNKQEDFIKQYALNNDLVFFVFGD